MPSRSPSPGCASRRSACAGTNAGSASVQVARTAETSRRDRRAPAPTTGTRARTPSTSRTAAAARLEPHDSPFGARPPPGARARSLSDSGRWCASGAARAARRRRSSAGAARPSGSTAVRAACRWRRRRSSTDRQDRDLLARRRVEDLVGVDPRFARRRAGQERRVAGRRVGHGVLEAMVRARPLAPEAREAAGGAAAAASARRRRRRGTDR